MKGKLYYFTLCIGIRAGFMKIDIIKGGPTTRPPILNDINYAYWKARTTAFLKSIGNKTWKVVIIRCEPPTITANEKTSKTTTKLELEWTDVEDQSSFGNSHALNAICNGFDQNLFKLINTCKSAKRVGKFLEVAYKGTSKVKTSLQQLLSSKFEYLKMIEMI